MEHLLRRQVLRRVGALSIALGVVFSVVGGIAGGAGADTGSGFTTPPGVTITPGGENCNGVVPPGNQTNTAKTLTGGDLRPGGTADYTISFPTDPANVGDFEIVDCVLFVPAGMAAKDFTSVISEATFSLVNNSSVFNLGIGVAIPSGVHNGDQICNVAKTTESPSASPASNRKAGPACFVIGGSARVEKQDANTHALLDGATFHIGGCVNPAPNKELQPIVVTAEDKTGSPLSTAGLTTSNGVPSGTVVAAALGFNGPSGSSCAVTETVAPPGYLLPSQGTPPGSDTVTVSIGANTQTLYVFGDRPATPDLTITKTADAGTVPAGHDIGFSITVTNTGLGTAKNVTIADPLPSGPGISWSVAAPASGCAITTGTLDCTVGDLAPQADFTVHVTSATTSDSCATYDNTATVHAANNADREASASVTVSCAQLVISKDADPAGPVSAGDPIGFRITVENTSSSVDATNVHVTDTYPTGSGLSWSVTNDGGANCTASTASALDCTKATLAHGASLVIRIGSPTVFASCATYENAASVGATNVEGTSHSNVASVVVDCPDLHITKTPDAASVNAGTPIGFSITVQNTGAGTARRVTLTDPLPTTPGTSWTIDPPVEACSISDGTLTCDFGSLAHGESATVHVGSPTTTASCATVDNTATVHADNNPDEQASASETVICPVIPPPPPPPPVNDLSIVKIGSPDPVVLGGNLTYTITATNNGPLTATGVTVTDVIPGNVTFVSATPATGSCSVTSGILTCSLGTMAVGSSIAITMVVTPQQVGTVANTAVVRGNETETNLTNNQATATNQVVAPAVLAVVVEQTTTTTVPPPTTTTTAPQVLGEQLARTGSNTGRWLRLGALFLVLGGFALVAADRRVWGMLRRR